MTLEKDPKRATRYIIFYVAAFGLCILAFRYVGMVGCFFLSLILLWAWGGIMANVSAYRYGFYDIDNPDTDEERAVNEKSTWIAVPLTLILFLWIIKVYVISN